MVAATPDTYAIASGSSLYAGITGYAAQSLGTNATWTWFNDPRAVYHNGCTYWMGVDSVGTTSIHRRDHANGAVTSFALGPIGQNIDDHNNGAILTLADGRIVAFWALHYDTVIRYRVSTAANSIAAFDAVKFLSGVGSPVTYPKPFRMSAAPGKQWCFYRNASTDLGVMCYRVVDDFGAASPTVGAEIRLANTPGKTAYVIMQPDGVNRVDVLCSDSHPVQANDCAAYHFYGVLDANGDFDWFKSDGTEITATQPFLFTSGSRISPLTERQWIWDIKRAPNGDVCVIWVRYMNAEGTDHRYMYARCVSGVWQASVQIAAAGGYLYQGERYYSGGCVFDSQDVNTIYASVQVGGVFQIQRYTTGNSGASWELQETYTSGGTFNNPHRARPYSPRNHNGDIPLLWWQGDYTTYIDFDTVTHALVKQT